LTNALRHCWYPSVFALLILLVTQRSSSAHFDTLVSNGRVSVVESGEVVVSVETTGAYPGLLTLRLMVDGAGTVTAGQFALVVTEVQDLNEDGTVNENPEPHDETQPHEPGEPHVDRMRIVDRGTLSGAVTGGTLASNADGTLTLTGVTFNATEKSLTFEGSGDGAGTINADLGLTGTQGSLQLHF
jgi:hypothetical protein